MTAIVNMHQAKSQLSKLVERARMGEEVVIANNGHPLVRLVPVTEKPKQRPMGLLAGQMWMSPDFNDPLPDDYLEAFE
ncbi:MAG: type II toxin-antitoxin system Phd/YefM family antitoxin [Alphaproteobacteria bacterium]|jgi:prevent-host-death family protein|nr:type II toxin-antitoxin system Phd/YefM family antitoxin [Alphaproteobacteria bacterium]